MAVTLSLHAGFFLCVSVYIKLTLVVCVSVCRDRRGRIRGMISACHHYGTSDCQAVSHVSQAFCSSFFPPLSNLSLITLSSLSFSWQLSLHPLHVQAPSALPFLPIHSSVCFFLVSNSPLLLLHFPSHFSSFPLVIKCPTPPVISL